MRIPKTLSGSLVAGLFIASSFLPSFAAAAETSTRMTQLLPVGGTSCKQLTVTSVTPYVYGGALNSFDVVMPDTSYVALGATVGNTPISFQYLNRSFTPDGQLRVHTDIASMPVGYSLPVSIVLLSAKDGILCAATVSFYVTSSNAPVTSIVSAPHVSRPVKTIPSTTVTPSTSTKPAQTATTAPAVIAQATPTNTGCSTPAAALKLWLVLLALYIAISALASLIQPSLAQKNPAIPVALILVPLIGLVGFWYFSPACRAASWVPIVLLITAIVGLLVAFREQKGTTLLLPLVPAPKQPPMQMPAAKPAAPATNGHVEKIVTQVQNAQQKNQQSGQKK